MASAVRVRVELKNYNPNATPDERDYAFKKLFTAFNRACMDAGIKQEYKRHETFESKSRKRRRKKRESEIQRLKSQLKENLTPPWNNKGNKQNER